MSVYRFFYLILKNILLLVHPFLNANIQQWVRLRKHPLTLKNNYKNTYWFHASSGEIEYCKSVIRSLKHKLPQTKIIVTYSSSSAEKLFYNILEHVDEFIPLCWDEPAAVLQLITYINPQMLIFSRTDFWPELIHQAHKQNIKLGVLSFNPKNDFLNKLKYQCLLKDFSFVSCVNENTELNLKHISNDGDTRFDQVFYRLSQASKINIIPTHSQILVCGSTWPEDEKIILKSFELLKNKYKLVLSPHDVSAKNLTRLSSELHAQKLNFKTLSSLNPQSIIFDFEVLLIDQIGYLADCYRYANVAFVGGSFKDKVHSVMEPLCCGKPVLTGPLIKNSPEALYYLGKFVFIVNNACELTEKINAVLAIKHEDILSQLTLNKNATTKIVELILNNSLKH